MNISWLYLMGIICVCPLKLNIYTEPFSHSHLCCSISWFSSTLALLLRTSTLRPPTPCTTQSIPSCWSIQIKNFKLTTCKFTSKYDQIIFNNLTWSRISERPLFNLILMSHESWLGPQKIDRSWSTTGFLLLVC